MNGFKKTGESRNTLKGKTLREYSLSFSAVYIVLVSKTVVLSVFSSSQNLFEVFRMTGSVFFKIAFLVP